MNLFYVLLPGFRTDSTTLRVVDRDRLLIGEGVKSSVLTMLSHFILRGTPFTEYSSETETYLVFRALDNYITSRLQ